MEIKYSDLKNKPRLHGNGFIQLDIDDIHRLDVWPEIEIHAQKVNTQIHSHKFDFYSKVLLGKLLHITYDLVPNMSAGQFQLYNTVPTKGEDTELRIFSYGKYDIFHTGSYVLAKDSSYIFNAGRFHETSNLGLTATLLTKRNINNGIEPLVVCGIDKSPDNAFNRYQVDEEVLWSEIEKVFNKINSITI